MLFGRTSGTRANAQAPVPNQATGLKPKAYRASRKNSLPGSMGTVMVFWLPTATVGGCGETSVHAVGETTGEDWRVNRPKSADQAMVRLLPDRVAVMTGLEVKLPGIEKSLV